MRAKDFIKENKVEVKPAGNKGNGLFAIRPIKKGEVITDDKSTPISDEDWKLVKNTEPVKLYGFKWGNEHGFFPGEFPFSFKNKNDKKAWTGTEVCKKYCPNGLSLSGFNFVNDSDTPNAEEKFNNSDKSGKMIAIKDILPGEEITKKYNFTGKWK